MQPAAADGRWLARVWPQVYDTEIHLSPSGPWLSHALGGLQRLLH